jgi:hypothetical protein
MTSECKISRARDVWTWKQSTTFPQPCSSLPPYRPVSHPLVHNPTSHIYPRCRGSLMASASSDATVGREHTTATRPAQAPALDDQEPPRRIWSRAYLMQDVNPDLSTIPLAAYCFMTGWMCVPARRRGTRALTPGAATSSRSPRCTCGRGSRRGTLRRYVLPGSLRTMC